MQILVAGSDRYSQEKERIIDLFAQAKYEVDETCALYSHYGGGQRGDEAVIRYLVNSDFLYVVTGEDGYTGVITTLFIGYANAMIEGIPTCYSNLPLADEDYKHWVTVRSAEEIIKDE